MTKAKLATILTAATGLNNANDPARLEFDRRTGVTELSQAVNVDFDSSGRPSRRLGRVRKLATEARCGFAFGGVCLFVSGSTLYGLSKEYGAIELRTDLTPGARMRYYPIAGRIYYINGRQRGYVYKETDYAWEAGSYALQHDTPRVFTDPPLGHIVGWFSGRALVAKDNAIFASEPSFYGVFNLHKVRMVPDRVTMLLPTPQGLWVGTTKQVLFYRGNHWERLVREPKAEVGVLEGSGVLADGARFNESGRVAFFTTPEGVCTGSEGGALTNITYQKVVFPSGRYASAAVVGNRYIVNIEG